MERSLVLIKPDGVKRGLCGDILSRLEKENLKLAALKMLRLDVKLAQKLYAPHHHKPFFDSVVTYISSGPVIAAIFEGENAIERVRGAMGATDPAQADTGTIRKDFGLNIERNTIHGSDSAATAKEEIRLFFTEDELFNYQRESGR